MPQRFGESVIERTPRIAIKTSLLTCNGPSPAVSASIVLLLLVSSLGAVLGGPPLGDHEAIVAECARNMRLSGDWLVPQFLDTPFLRKPPLPYWLVAGTSFLLPHDPDTGLPVTALVARLPSALAAFGTVLLLWRLGTAMFGGRAGIMAAVIAGSSLCFMLYAPNATAEMILTFCCTWACLHFWFAVTCHSPRRRLLHLLLFYIALGLGMLAKGPAPLPLTAVPLAVWWYTERPLRVLAKGGMAGARRAPVVFIRGLKSRTVQAFTRLGLIPGLIVFALMFVPWILAVAAKHPHAWDLWNWQYVQRAEGDYLDSRPRGVFYYLPLVLGFSAPWLFLLPEALLSPWMKRYTPARRALLFCGVWAMVGIMIMSLEPFKKPYYILPGMPALILMMAVVADRFYGSSPPSARLGWAVWALFAVSLIIALVVGSDYVRQEAPDTALRIMLIASVAALALLIAGVCYVRRRGWWAVGVTATATIAAFQLIWHTCGSTIASVEKVAALYRTLETAGVPAIGPVLWVDQRPDARLSFYFARQSRYMITPAEIVTEMLDRTQGKDKLLMMTMERASDLLKSPQPVYLILARKNYDLMKSELFGRAFLIDAIHLPGDPARKDWMVVSNVQQSQATRGTP